MTRIIDLFRYNLLKKLIALVAAFLMWIYVMAEQDPPIEDSYTVSLTASNAPYELVPLYEEKTIQVVTRAARSNFFKYDSNAFRAYINLEGLGEGEHQITPQVFMPPGFELVDTTPQIIKVKLDPLIERQMPIEILTTGSVAKNSAVKEISKSMDMVTIVGPKSYVEKTKRVYGTINFSGNASSFEWQIPVRAVGTIDDKETAIPFVRVVPSVITVSVQIESGLKKKVVPVVPELTAPEGWELTKIYVDPAQVEISGIESVINQVVTLKTEPFIVQTGQRNFKGTLELILPEGVSSKVEEVNVSAEIIRRPVVKDRSNN